MNNVDIIFIIAIICIVAISIHLSVILYTEKYEAAVSFVCDAMEPKHVLTRDECRQVIDESSRGSWGWAVDNAVKSKTPDYFLLYKCKDLASISDVSKSECYAYMENNPGSTGNQVIDGVLEQRDNHLNRLLTEPLN